ncbi:hypothetical protein ACFY2W_26085 [Streptomyces sp. NPDC001262]|uniref:hypothetical protein n=1 Tax=Streptomyces sp. NPDC001262 TaxID=3364552 RepID=UPI0036CA589B
MNNNTLRHIGASVLAAVVLVTAEPVSAIAAPGQPALVKTTKNNVNDLLKKAAHDAKETARAAGTQPSVTVKKIFLGAGTVTSVDVSFEYSCTPVTDRLEVTFISIPDSPTDSITLLKTAKTRHELQCDGTKHTDFVEWADRTVTSKSAQATISLYGKGNVLQAPMAEKIMKLDYDIPPIGTTLQPLPERRWARALAPLP